MKRKQLAILLGTTLLSVSALPCVAADEQTADASGAAVQAAQETGETAADASQNAAAAGEEPTDETEQDDSAQPGNEDLESASEAEIGEAAAEDAAEEDPSLEGETETESESADEKKKKKKKEENLVDKDGLIVDEGEVTSNSIEGDPETSLEELWDDQMHNRQFPGFEVDPSRYPAANITVNTVTLYRFLTKEMKLNHAAACGVLANIQLESNFRPLALGDSGTSYGICQWHNGRFTSLMSFCKARGLDYNTLEGQMKYLQWDLTHGYKGVYEMLLKVKDTKKGAYQAGYLFCYHFEIPDQVVARSKRRGNLAMTEYYNKNFTQLEWELRHSALVLGEDWLGLMPEQVPAVWNVPENAPAGASVQASSPQEEEGGSKGQTAEDTGDPEEGSVLPEWQSTLGEPSILL